MFGEVGEVGGVTPVPIPGCVLGLRGLVAPEVPVVPEAGAVADDPGWVVPLGDVAAVPGVVCELLPELCVFTVPLESTQGVVLPGTVVPGIVLGGLAGVPGVGCEFEGLDVIPGTVADPLSKGVQG